MSEKLFELYGGKAKGKFLGPTPESPSRHMYYVNGKRKTGVTTICGIKDKSNALVSWSREETARHLLNLLERGEKITEKSVVAAAYASEDIKTRAADLGSKIHEWIEQFIKYNLHGIEPGQEMPEMPEDANVLTGVNSFLEWVAAHDVKFLWSERLLYSLEHDYIGTGDFGAIVDGKTCLCDIKTGNGMYNTVRMQTAAYAKADEEECGAKYDGRWAIRIAKETKAEYLERMELKNKVKQILGGNVNNVEPYQVFEAKFLDEEEGSMKYDFDGFLHAWGLLLWDRKTDFWKEKHA